MLIMSKHYPVEQRECAVKMVLDYLDEDRSVYAACPWSWYRRCSELAI